MIDVEIWQSGKGSRPLWRGKLPAIPREGETLSVMKLQGRVERVYWRLGPQAATTVHIYLLVNGPDLRV